MKKILFGMFAATAMLLTSCSQDDFSPVVAGEEANVTISLTTPQLASRAYSDGTTATHLQYAVYEKTGEGDAATYRRLDTYTVTNETINISKQINFRLVNGKTYTFVFWAAAPNAEDLYDVTFTETGAEMQVNYGSSFKANLEDLDAFFVSEDLKVTGDVQKTFELRRPFAQINVGTNDFAEAEAVGYVPTSSRIVVTGIYNQLDLISGNVKGTAATRTFNYNALPDRTVEKFPVDGYDYLAMTYVLVPETQELVTVQFAYGVAGGTAETRQVGSVPVQRNYRTNLFGQILTSNAEVNVIIEPDYYDPDYTVDELVMAAALGGTINLTKDVTVDQDMIFRKDGIVNLNGQTLTEDNSTFTLASGANVTINGPGTIAKTGMDAYKSTAAVYVNHANSTLTINGGTITSDGVEAVFVQVGKAEIYGGYFAAANQSGGKYYTLNCNDTNYKNKTANIIVYGGTFENFDPANNGAEGENTNFVADGYKSVPVTVNGKSCYMVVPENVGTVASTGTEAQEALAAGEDVVLADNMTVQAESGAYGNAKAAFVIKGGQTLDGGGNTITANGAFSNTYDAVVTMNDGTLKNATVANGFRGVLVNFSNTGDVVLENVKVLADSKCTYALNVNEGNGTCNFLATNCAFYGWSSWGPAAKQFTFVNCMFGAAQYNVVKPYWNTVFDNCQFEEGMYMDLSSLKADATLIFRNCTVNGQKITKENHAQYFEDWENWDASADRIIFE